MPELVEGYLRDLLELTRGAGLGEVREYETTPEERTSDNPLGIYRLTLENIRERTPGELDELRRERAERLRALYEFLGCRRWPTRTVPSKCSGARATI